MPQSRAFATEFLFSLPANMPTVIEPTVCQGTYQWHENTENLERYVPGSYHPVHIGEKYDGGRYEIVHKLRFGSYSTVWLAHDMSTSTFVAIKIITANGSKSTSEGVILSRLSSGATNHPGRPNVQTLLDEFYITGPNGHHRCIVSEALGCSIAQSKTFSDTWKFQPQVARKIATQVLRGLAYTHSCGVVHGGLHSQNLLFKLPRFKTSCLRDLYKSIGEPQQLPVERLDKRPKGPEAPQYCVPCPIIVTSAVDVVSSDIVIADFGQSFISMSNGRVDATVHTPILLRPPESIFNEPLSQAVDMWTAGCTLYDILGERPLFEGFAPDKHHAVAEMISTLGPLPKRWWNSWSGKKEFFLNDGLWDPDTKRAHAAYDRPLAERLRVMAREDDFSSHEFTLLDDLLRSMLSYEPKQRLTAEAALSHPWVTKYGLEDKKIGS